MCTNMQVFRGKVVTGKNRGKDLGFPTANMAVHQDIPEGIYLAKIKVGAKIFNGLTFIGRAITFGERKLHAESYLLDFSGNLYGKFVTVSLIKKIRDNKKFTSAEELIAQMNEDLAIARKFFAPWC